MGMYSKIRLAIITLGLLIPWKVGAVDPCACPKVSCHSECEIETEVKFYTEKCGPNLSRVRSCAKPTCVKVDG